MYVRLNGNAVFEIIPDIDPIFPEIQIESRYPPYFLAELIHVDDSVEVHPNWIYNSQTGSFSEPEPTEAEPIPIVPPAPSKDEQMRADIDYIAAITGVQL